MLRLLIADDEKDARDKTVRCIDKLQNGFTVTDIDNLLSAHLLYGAPKLLQFFLFLSKLPGCLMNRGPG